MEVKKIVLKNGLRIILVPQLNSLTATNLILVEAGSEYETKDINGISHFLEHMCFKGTKNRPQPGMIAEELDSLGAEYNAFTSQEYTGYWAKVQKNKINEVIEILSDLYLNPIFNPQEIEKERGVIIEEINMYEDIPMRRVHDLFLNLLYGDQPAGWDIAGQKEIIKKLQREDFINYRKKHYIPSKTIIVIGGGINSKEVYQKIKNIFEKLPYQKKVLKTKTVWKQEKPKVVVRFKESDQDHLVLGLHTFDIKNPKKYALQVLSNILGGGMSSRLFKKIREELGAAYYIKSEVDLFLDHGYLAISVGTDRTKTKLVIKNIIKEIIRLKKELIPENELEKAKNHIIGNFILGLETSDELSAFYGINELLLGKITNPKKIIEKIKKVKAEEVKELAQKLFKEQYLNLAIIGPYNQTKEFQKVLTFD